MHTRQRPLLDYDLRPIPPRSAPSIDPADLPVWLQPPTEFTAALAEAIAWIAASAAVRIVMDWLLASSSAFWVPILVGIVAPAAIAIGLSTIMPRWSLVLGYRLILIMVGLLIGGKL